MLLLSRAPFESTVPLRISVTLLVRSCDVDSFRFLISNASRKHGHWDSWGSGGSPRRGFAGFLGVSVRGQQQGHGGLLSLHAFSGIICQEKLGKTSVRRLLCKSELRYCSGRASCPAAMCLV